MRRSWLGILFLVVAGCDQSAYDLPDFGDDPPPGPGSPNWADTDLTCRVTADCAPGETCEQGSCRPKQCDDGPYLSEVPLGANRVFFREQELLVVDTAASGGKHWVDGYDATGTVGYNSGSLSFGAAITDVSGIHTPKGGAIVTAAAGSTIVTVAGRTVPAFQIQTGIVPVAVGAGDVDGDLEDEVVVLAADGKIRVCSLAGVCQGYTFSNNEVGVDLTVADTTGDGVAEVIFLLRAGNATRVAVWSVGVEGGFFSAAFQTRFKAVAAGDVDRDGRAEIALLEDRGWFGFASDRIHVYRVGSGLTGINSIATTSSAVDLAAGDVDGTDAGDVFVVLGSNRDVDVLRWTGSSVTKAYGGSVAATSSPGRIALGDLDNDSVSARLVSGPELVPGRLMPTMVATFPPYDATTARGALPGVGIGSRTEMAESAADSVALRAGVEIGVEADFIGLFKARLSTKLEAEITKIRALNRLEIVASKFSLRPQVELYGNQYGAVVVGCNCFHRYDYELIDAGNRAGGTGRKLTMIVPVGGQVTVLSTPRYNALADLTGDLPRVDVATRIGDPASYSRTPTKLDGTPVAAAEHVFRTLPTLRVSDVATMGFWMLVSETETNTAAMLATVSVNGSVSVPGVTFGASLGGSWGKSFAVTVGTGAEFSGEVPPIANDPATPEDEYKTRAFSYSPFVYRQPYADPITGETSGFYVLDYAVSGP